MLLPSSTIHYTFNQTVATSILGKPCASAANPVSGVTIGGVALNPTASYRITTNNFLADGGDDFQSLKAGTDRTTLSDFDIDSLVRYLAPSLQPGAPRSGRRRWIASTSPRREHRTVRRRPCAAAARSGTIGGV